MRAIIFTQQSEAEAALETCTTNIPKGEVRQEGEGPFITPEPGRPYSSILKHPFEEKWALIADDKVEAVLGQTAEKLDNTWFPTSALTL